MSYLYWFVRKVCTLCGQPFSCPESQQDSRSVCSACKGGPYERR